MKSKRVRNNRFTKGYFLLMLIFLAAVLAAGCQTAQKNLPQDAVVSDDDGSYTEPEPEAKEPLKEVISSESESTPAEQKIPDITIDIDHTILVGNYSTLEGDKWLQIEWEEWEGNYLWLYFGEYDASGNYAEDWSACVDCNEISGNRIHTPVGRLSTSESIVTEIDMVYVPNMPEYETEAIYLDDGAEVYTFYRDIDSPRYEDYLTEPEFTPGEYDVPDQADAPAEGTIAYFRFLTEVGQYVVQDGNYVLTNAWTWANNEVVQYGSNGRPINYRTNNALPPVSMAIEIRVALPLSFSATEAAYQPCSEDVLEMGFDRAQIATCNNNP